MMFTGPKLRACLKKIHHIPFFNPLAAGEAWWRHNVLSLIDVSFSLCCLWRISQLQAVGDWDSSDSTTLVTVGRWTGLPAYLLLMRILRPYIHNRMGLKYKNIYKKEKKKKMSMEDNSWMDKKGTYAGHPSTIATHARIVLPIPYPSLLNIAGAKRGKPKPASDRKHETAASAIYI